MSVDSAVAIQPILRTDGLTKRFPVAGGRPFARRRREVHAVTDARLEIRPGETLGIVGESGSGKSTIARLVLGLTAPTAGTIWFGGHDLAEQSAQEMQRLRPQLQMVFQDPYTSFDPQSTIGASAAEPLHVHTDLGRAAARAKIGDLFDRVGLRPEHLDRFPSELSGGQLQRAAVARALALDTRLLVLDEPVSALDLSTQAQVVNLLGELQRDRDIAYLFIAHDISIVRHVSDRIAVMYLGRILEEGPAATVCDDPAHPYTRALLSAVPRPDPRSAAKRSRIVLAGDIPSPIAPPSGCPFRTRCPEAMAVCAEEMPPEVVLTGGTVRVSCHLYTASAQDPTRRSAKTKDGGVS